MATKAKDTDLTITTGTPTEDKPVKRGRGRPKGHAPSNPTGKGLLSVDREPLTPERRALISKMVTQTLATYSMPPVKDDQELADRFVQYFQHCAEVGERPTVEQLFQCTGHTIYKVRDWESGRTKGFSPQTSEIVKKAKEFLRVFDAKMVSEGSLNPVVYFFRAKNYYGMRDQQDLVVSPSQPMGPEPDEAKLVADYASRLPSGDYPATLPAHDDPAGD